MKKEDRAVLEAYEGAIGCDSCLYKRMCDNYEECSHIRRRNFGWRLPEDRDCPLWKDKDKLSIL